MKTVVLDAETRRDDPLSEAAPEEDNRRASVETRLSEMSVVSNAKEHRLHPANVHDDKDRLS